MLALLGAAAAVRVARWAPGAAAAVSGSPLAREGGQLPCAPLLAGCAVIGGSLAAALPMWQAGRANIVSWLRVGGPRVSRTVRTQALMLVLQGALSVLLLVGAGLFVRSLIGIQSASLGIDAGRLLVVSTLRGEAPPRADFRIELPRDRGQGSLESSARRARRARCRSCRAGRVRMNVPGLAERSHSCRWWPIHPLGGTRILRNRHDMRGGKGIQPGRSRRRAQGRDRQSVHGAALLAWQRRSASACRLVQTARRVRLLSASSRTHGGATLSKGSRFSTTFRSSRRPPDLRGGRLIVRTDRAMTPRRRRAIAETIRREALLLEPGLRYVTARALDDVISPQLRTWQLGAGPVQRVRPAGAGGLGRRPLQRRGVRRRGEAPRDRSTRRARRAVVRDPAADRRRRPAARRPAGSPSDLRSRGCSRRSRPSCCTTVAPKDAAVFAGASAALIAAALVASIIPALRAARIDPTEALKEQ